MKIIFLDIDGVITSARVQSFQTLDKYAVNFINHVCDQAPAEVVISSAWRSEDKSFFEQFFTHLHKDWRTTLLRLSNRGGEIQEWLDRHKVEDYLILDDESDMLGSQMGHFVKTDTYNGLLFGHMRKILEHFNIKKSPKPKIRYTT